MWILDARCLDLHGISRSKGRLRIVTVEFIASPPLGMAVAGALIPTGGEISTAVRAWLIGVGFNHAVLALYAIPFSRPGILRSELIEWI